MHTYTRTDTLAVAVHASKHTNAHNAHTRVTYKKDAQRRRRTAVRAAAPQRAYIAVGDSNSEVTAVQRREAELARRACKYEVVPMCALYRTGGGAAA
jgi:hypothetical protein